MNHTILPHKPRHKKQEKERKALVEKMNSDVNLHLENEKLEKRGEEEK